MSRSLASYLRRQNVIFFCVLFVFLLSSLTYYFYSQEKSVKNQLETAAESAKLEIHNNIFSIENNLKLLKEHLLISEMGQKANFIQDFDRLAVRAISPYKFQYNVYFALEPKLSLKSFGHSSYIRTHHRDIYYRNKKEYFEPNFFVRETWTKTKYSTDKSEVWYHVAKKSQDVEYTSIYFDRTYMKSWLITGALGIYKENEFQGMIGIDVLVDDFTVIAGKHKVGDEGGILILDKDSKRILSNTKIQNIKKYSEFSRNNPAVQQFYTDNYVKEIHLEKLPWKVVAYYSKAKVVEEVYVQIILAFILTLILFGFLFLFTKRTSDSIFFPTNELRTKLFTDIRKLNEGSHNVNLSKINVTYQIEELEDLKNSINFFIDKLNFIFKEHFELNENLDNQVQEKTKILNNQNEELERTLEQLKSAQSQLVFKEKMASLGNMTAGVAHEIKNPVYIIESSSEVISELLDEASEKHKIEEIELIKDLLGRVRKNCNRVVNVISTMRAITRGEQENKELNDLNSIIKEAISFSEQALRAKFKFEINTILDLSELPPFELHREEIIRMFINLYENSSFGLRAKLELEPDFIPEIKIKSKFEKGQIKIVFSDNGTGIPEDIIKNIFDPFFTTKKGTEGSGLGLSLVYDTIQRHNGTIHVDESFENGARFIIEIPVGS